MGPLYLDAAFVTTFFAAFVVVVLLDVEEDEDDVAIRLDVLDNIAAVPSLEEDVAVLVAAVDTALVVEEEDVGDRLVVA